MFVKFYCCDGFRNKKPMLHFIKRKNSEIYDLVAMNKWHDHRPKTIE